jgi:hypothetical protein
MACSEKTLIFKIMHKPYKTLKFWIKITTISTFTLYLFLVTFSSVVGQVQNMSAHTEIKSFMYLIEV